MKTKQDWFDKLLEKYLNKFKAAIKLEMQISNTFTTNQAKQQGSKTKLNPLNVSKKDLENFNQRVEMYVKGANQDISKKINKAILDNVAQKGSNQDLAKDIKSIFEEGSSNYFNYKNRFKTIARTESTNILSTSSYNTANKLGATKKWLLMTDDNRTSDISKAFNKKYGTPEKAIPINEEFTAEVNGKTYGGLLTPFHPSERDIVMYEFD
jgi:hypothetical protein